MTWTAKTWLDNSPPTLNDEDLNRLRVLIDNIITGAGLTPSTSDQQQTHRAIAIYAAGGDFYTDSGAANAYVLTPVGAKLAPTAYFDGMRIRFIPDNANTGASTVNAGGIGAVSIKRPDGTDVVAGNLPAGRPIELFHDIGTGTFVFAPNFATETEIGLLQFATAAEANALSVTDKAVSPGRIPIASNTQQGLVEKATVAEIRTGTDTSRYMAPADLKEHSSAIKVWVNMDGVVAVSIRDSIGVSSVSRLAIGEYRITFSTAFPNTDYCVVATCDQTAQAKPDNYVSIQALATTHVDLNTVSDSGVAFEDADTLCVMITANN